MAATSSATGDEQQQPVVYARTIVPDGEIKRDDDGQYVSAIRCPTAVIGLVAGKDQKNLREIVSKYQGLKIEIARRKPVPADQFQAKEKESFIDWLEGSRCSNINVIGSDKESVEAGLKAVTERVQVAKKRAPFTHCICLPFLESENPGFVSKIEEFKSHVLKTTSLENEGIDSSVMVSSKQIHFTLLMLMIYDEQTLAKVVTTISDFIQARKPKTPQFPLRLRFTGIHIFDTDKPTKTSVVYTHAGTAGVHTVTDSETTTGSSSASGEKQLDSATCTYTARALASANDRVQSMLSSGVAMPSEIRGKLEVCTKTMGDTVDTLREFAKAAPKATKEGSRRPRDISTVSGPKVEEIFEMFSDLVAKLSDAGVLTEEDRRERRIVENPDGTLAKTSLTLHVTLMSAKWRSPAATRALQQHRAEHQGGQNTSQNPGNRQRSFRRGRNFKGQPLTMNVSSILDDKFDFGEAVISQMHLSRRANTGAEMLTVEKVFNLC